MSSFSKCNVAGLMEPQESPMMRILVPLVELVSADERFSTITGAAWMQATSEHAIPMSLIASQHSPGRKCGSVKRPRLHPRGG